MYINKTVIILKYNHMYSTGALEHSKHTHTSDPIGPNQIISTLCDPNMIF